MKIIHIGPHPAANTDFWRMDEDEKNAPSLYIRKRKNENMYYIKFIGQPPIAGPLDSFEAACAALAVWRQMI